MNFRNKHLATTIRIIFGLFMVFSGVTGLLALKDLSNIPPEMLQTTQVLIDTGIFHMIKITEVVAGLMLVLNFLPALAVIFIAPIAVGIVVVNSLTAPQFVVMGVIVGLFVSYLGYVYWNKYKALFQGK